MSTEQHRVDVEPSETAARTPEAITRDAGAETEGTTAIGAESEVNAGNANKSQETPSHEEASESSALGKTEEQIPSSQLSPKLTPAEAFTALGETVHLLRGDVEDVGSFVRVCRDKLIRQADEYRIEGMNAVLESLMRLHDLVYRQVTTMESGTARPDAFILNLFEAIEAELRTHGIEVVRPQPGEELNLEVMTTIGTMPCPFWRKPDKVAQITSCGFVLSTESRRRVMRKADITVYRR